jgi:uracil-DNA glycosylase
MTTTAAQVEHLVLPGFSIEDLLLPVEDIGVAPACRQAFDSLVGRVQACQRCPRMNGRARVLGPANGSLRAALLFVAEAPGRLGADRSSIPLFGDQTGRNFDALLAAAQLRRGDVFITNAVLCNPRDEQGRNAPPTEAEIQNCSDHLRDTIALVNPRYVVALGTVALRALARIVPHEARLADDVGRVIPWFERFLVPLYHPGPRARVHRPFSLQMQDYQMLAALLAPVTP